MHIGAATANFFAAFSNQYIIYDLAYGDESRQKLNIYRPGELKETETAPVIVFFYGGGWKSGSRDMYRFAAEPFTSRGFIVVIPEYAHYPQYRYPTFVKDGAKAVAWVQKNIRGYLGDPQQIFLTGHSAGAHLAALLATNNRYLEAEGTGREGIIGMAGLAGPYDFVPEDEDIKKIFSAAGGTARSAMPATYVDGTQPPMLLLWGEDDEQVGRQNIDHMQKRIAKKGGELNIITYKDVGHIGIIAALSKPMRDTAPVVRDMTDFFLTRIQETLPSPEPMIEEAPAVENAPDAQEPDEMTIETESGIEPGESPQL